MHLYTLINANLIGFRNLFLKVSSSPELEDLDPHCRVPILSQFFFLNGNSFSVNWNWGVTKRSLQIDLWILIAKGKIFGEELAATSPLIYRRKLWSEPLHDCHKEEREIGANTRCQQREKRENSPACLPHSSHRGVARRVLARAIDNDLHGIASPPACASPSSIFCIDVASKTAVSPTGFSQEPREWKKTAMTLAVWAKSRGSESDGSALVSNEI